jgi:hypothetical protein
MLERREQMIGWAKNDNDKTRYENENHFIKHTMLPIINEAEAKWESECCEWKRPKGYDNCMGEHKCEVFFINRYMVKQFNFCPFCGKPIKISEVE